MPTRAQKFMQLRGSCEAQALSLRKQNRFNSEREERQILGRIQTLERVAGELSVIEKDTKPARVQAIVEGIIALLAEHKATWTVNYIRERRRFGINELGEWTGEGAISQIDEIFLQLRARLSPDWNWSSFKQHGKYFQVFHSLDLASMQDVEMWKERWCLGQEKWYQEVAILRVNQANDESELFFWLAEHGHRGWEANREVFWIQPRNVTYRATSVGDIVVSLLSGTAWMMVHTGFQVIEPDCRCLVWVNVKERSSPGHCTASKSVLSDLDHNPNS